MARYVGFLLILITASAGLRAQEDDTLFRAVNAEPSIESFRPVGDSRTWIFYANQTTFGRLFSTVSSTREINDREAFVFTDSLSIDYTMIGTQQKVQTKGDFFVAPDGSFLGCDLTLGPDSASERLEMELDDRTLEGYYTRAGTKVDIDVPMESDLKPWEMYFVDQLEVFLALRDLAVGDTIIDSIYSPQIMMSTRIVGQVTRWMWQEIYKNKIDSVFIIRLTEPGDFQLYFTADKRLVRVDMENQNVRVYQGMIQQTTPTGAGRTAQQRDWRMTVRLMFLRLPHYIAFLAIALLSILFLTRSGFKRFDSWLAFVVGGIAFILIPYTQIPLQIYLVGSWLIPNISEGGSIYFWSIFPAAAGGIVQTLYVFLLLTALFYWRRIRQFHRAAVGAFLGGGFALIEACYVSGLNISVLFTPILVERGFLILFHVVAGTIIGAAIGRGVERVTVALILAALVNSILRFLPIFIQQEVLAVLMMIIVMGFICLAFLVYTLLVLRSDARET